MSRQENDSMPVVEQEPQRLDWSRTATRLTATPRSRRIAQAGGFQVALGFAAQKIADAAVDVRRVAGDA